MPKVQRMLRWFSRQTDEMVGEEPLRTLTLDTLRPLFDARQDPNLHLSHRVEPTHRDTLQPHLTHRFDFDAHDYFIEVDAPGSAPATIRPSAHQREAG